MPGFGLLEEKIRKELKKYSDEDMMWIYEEVLDSISDFRGYNCLQFKDIENFTQISEVRDFVIKKISREIELNENNLEKIFENIKNAKNNFLNNEIFTQYKKDLRLCLFSINYFDYQDDNNIISLLLDKYIFELTTPETVYIRFIFYIYSNKKSKKIIEESIKLYYDCILNKVNKSKNFQDQNFLDWTYNYLKCNNKLFSSIYSLNNESYYLGIISYLDFYSFTDNSGFFMLSMKINKAWSQKKFRDTDKIKTNYHLPLTKDRKEKLKKLAEFHNKTESQILENLIEEMYLKKMCDENGNLKYQ